MECCCSTRSHPPFFLGGTLLDELQPADVSGSWRLLRIKRWILVDSRGGHQWRAPRRGIGNGWRSWKTTWDDAVLQWPALPGTGGNPVNLGLGRAKDLFCLFWCQRIDPEELLGRPPCAPQAGSAPCPALGTLWNVHPEDAPRPAGRTSSCFPRDFWISCSRGLVAFPVWLLLQLGSQS